MKRYRLLVFDWDGTLMDSEARICNAFAAAAADLHIDAPPIENVRAIIGLGMDDALAALFPGRDDLPRRELIDRYRVHFLDENAAPMPLFPAAAEVLARLEGRGHLLAVATGKSRRGLDRALAESGLQQRFAATRCADEAWPKPHPQMVLDLLEMTGTAAGEALVIGDTEYDLQMAAAAGTDAAGVSWGVHGTGRLAAQAPLTILESLPQILEWLEE